MNHPHNAHPFETVTVYYRWHPLFGLSLPVHKRRKTSNGERVFCQLPDGRLCAVPSWMLRPDCAQYSLGCPLISVEALCELRNLLAAWQTSGICGKALLKSPAKEGGDETTSEATQLANEPATSQCARDRSSQPQAKGTGGYTHGATNQGSQPQPHHAATGRRGR
jgi:hypothetical protein